MTLSGANSPGLRNQTEIENEGMNLNQKTIAAGALLLAAVPAAQAQYAPPPPTQPFPGFLNQELRAKDPYWANWDFGAQLRLRYESKDDAGFTAAGAAGDFKKTGVDNNNAYFMTKLLLRVGYTDQWWSAFIQGRNSTTTGDDRNPNVESDGLLDLHQAYVTLGNHKEFPVSLKVGRQELSYGEERLVGAFAWNNVGRVFDAAKLRWQHEHFTAEAFTSHVVIPNDNNFNVSNEYDYFSGLYVTTKAIPKQSSDFYFLARNTAVGSATVATVGLLPATAQTALNGPGPRDIYTLGARGKSDPGAYGNWDYTYEVMAQFGHFNERVGATIRSQKQEAYAYVLNGGYTFADTAWTPRLGLEYSYASGDSNPADNKHETFENLFPTNHKFYGYMDFLALQNLHDVRVMLTAKPTPQLSVALEGHLFWLADDRDSLYAVNGAPRGGLAGTPGTGYGLNSRYSKFVGGEIDFIAGYALNKFTSIEVGAGHFFTGGYLNSTFSAAGGSTDANWCYLQTTLNF
ncbi:MAG: hypothetical protein EBS84_05070 [Proteobacteria bacterium]|nr:hypothetical protein [Verrucomicrobiota bacterium]NBU08371.1 hypothetical protein [Pseudomonadota bacterium]